MGLALDDFGTGYSSLSYLDLYPFDALKIDKAFVDPVGGTARASLLAQTIITMGRTLGVRTIAKGIERIGQADALREWGCTYGQGYLFARRLPPAEMEALLRRTRPAGPVAADPAEHVPSSSSIPGAPVAA